jgi:hypothetical protein
MSGDDMAELLRFSRAKLCRAERRLRKLGLFRQRGYPGGYAQAINPWEP